MWSLCSTYSAFTFIQRMGACHCKSRDVTNPGCADVWLGEEECVVCFEYAMQRVSGCESLLESSNLFMVVSVRLCVLIVCAFCSKCVLLCALRERPLCFNACLG